MKKLFRKHFLIKDAIRAERENYGTDKYDEQYMDILYEALFGCHMGYLLNIVLCAIIIKSILK